MCISDGHVAGPRGSSPFLIAVAGEIARRRGAGSPAAQAALEIAVDSTAFYERTTKPGPGSSAAVVSMRSFPYAFATHSAVS